MSFLVLRDIGPIQETFASATGRALAICQHFEDCARHVMVVWGITDQMYAGVDNHEALRELGLRLGKLGLGDGVKRLKQSEDFGSDHVAVLERGRDARNWFAHDSLRSVGFRSSRTGFGELLDEYKHRLRELCEADALASRASYEICEKEPAPAGLLASYADGLFAWALGPILGLVGTLAENGR